MQLLDKPGPYVRILFVDFSLAFNTKPPHAQTNSALRAHLHLSVDQQLPDRQAAGSEAGKINIQHPYNQHWSSPGLCSLPISLLLYTKNSPSKDPSVELLKFADDTTVIDLIQDSDESAYRQEVKELVFWCSLNNLELNMLKTLEMIVDFRRTHLTLPPSHHHEQHSAL